MSQLSPTTLAGHWIRIAQTPTDVEIYPEKIEFRADGCYLTPMRGNTFYEWQAGDFEIVDEAAIKIQISNDAMVSYHYKMSEGRLTFTAADGSSVSYKKL